MKFTIMLLLDLLGALGLALCWAQPALAGWLFLGLIVYMILHVGFFWAGGSR